MYVLIRISPAILTKLVAHLVLLINLPVTTWNSPPNSGVRFLLLLARRIVIMNLLLRLSLLGLYMLLHLLVVGLIMGIVLLCSSNWLIWLTLCRVTYRSSTTLWYPGWTVFRCLTFTYCRFIVKVRSTVIMFSAKEKNEYHFGLITDEI